jgi:hypothetical protein
MTSAKRVGGSGGYQAVTVPSGDNLLDSIATKGSAFGYQ